MKISDKINNALHPWFSKRLVKTYRSELRRFESLHPESFGRISESLRDQHIKLWSRLIPKPYDGWLRLLTKLSGKNDYRFVPADAYYAVVERCLNDCNYSGAGIEDKNHSAFYVPSTFAPKTLLRYVRGVFFDGEYNPVTERSANAILNSYKDDVVGKQGAESCGGASVRCFKDNGAGEKVCGDIILSSAWIAKNYETYLVQERIVQEPVVRSFNPNSVNTCRLVTFRRPWSGEVSVIGNMLRMGCGNEIVDNMSSGGVCVGVLPNGRMSSTGVDPTFAIVTEHPRSHLKFDRYSVPGYKEMSRVACDIARRVPGHNLLGFDMIMRDDGVPCVIEVNATSLASIMVQMSKPLFGEETEEVVEWCLRNRRFDQFKHVRTFY